MPNNVRNNARSFPQDPVILEYRQPVVGRPAAPLPYRVTHPLQASDDGSPDGCRPAGDGGVSESQQHQGEQQEEPQYVTPLPADDPFEGVDAELLKDAERFGRFRGSEMMLVDDGHVYCDDDDDDDAEEDDGGGDGDGNDEDEDGDDDDDDDDAEAANALDGEDADDDDGGGQNVEEEEDDDRNGEEIVLEADTNQFDDDEEDNAYDESNAALRINGAVSSYNWK